MQVPHAALVRLTQGAAAEARYRASVENLEGSGSVTRDGSIVKDVDGDDNDGEGSRGGGDRGGGGNDGGSGGDKEMTPLLRFGSAQFNLLRSESEKFNDRDKKKKIISSSSSSSNKNGDIDSNRSNGMYPDPNAESMSGLDDPAAPEAAAAAAAAAVVRDSAAAAAPDGWVAVVGSESTSGGSASGDGGWDEAVPEQAVLVADGFLVPGKSDGGVYIVVPAGAEKAAARSVSRDSDGGGLGTREEGMGRGRGREGGAGRSGSGERIVRLTCVKR